MKKYFKNTWFNYLIVFVLSFMLFIMEPINLYSSNLNDFWFDLSILLKPSLLLFIISFIGLIVLSNIIYLLNKKIYKIYNIILFIGFLCTYIQGNFLSGNLPVLNGESINWNMYTDMIISIILWLIVIITTIVIFKKINIDKYLKFSGYISLAIFAMLSVSLITTFLTTDVLKYYKKDIILTSTYKDINKYSENENFIILLLDAVDSKHFIKAIKDNKEFSNTLNDFTYYPDTMSVHPFTRESIPLILSGVVYEDQEEYNKYVIDSMKKSELLNNLYNKDYEVNIYEREWYFNDDKALKINNISYEGSDLNYKGFSKQLIKYDLFRYLPYFLKKYSNIETMDFSTDHITNNSSIDNPFDEDNFLFVNELNNDIIKDSKKNFKFIHIDGAHSPFKFSKDLSSKSDATYTDEVEGSLNIADMYLNKLKENNVYNNSNIIIMADHGYNYSVGGSAVLEGRQNPILFVKTKNENHEKMAISDKAVSFTDLQSLYNDILNGKMSNELLKNIDNNRTRRFLIYEWTKEYHMIEYETKDKAWETNKMYKTGKEFNLK